MTIKIIALKIDKKIDIDFFEKIFYEKTCLCSVNTTFREEEFYNYEDYGSNPGEFWNQNADYQNDAPLPQDHFSVKNKGVNRENIVYNPGNPMFYNCDERIPTSLAPLEMGVIWTRAGPVGKSEF